MKWKMNKKKIVFQCEPGQRPKVSKKSMTAKRGERKRKEKVGEENGRRMKVKTLNFSLNLSVEKKKKKME